MKPTRGRPERPSPPPLEADDQLVIRVVSAGWAVALVVLLIVRGSLPAGQRWWIWTCVCGLALGFFGTWYVPRLKRGRARAAMARGEAEQRGESGEGSEGAEGAEGPEGVEGPQSAPRDSGSNTVSPTDTPGSSTRS